MKNTFGTSVSVTLFGESHGPAIGAVLDGMAPGIKIDEEYIASQMAKRRSVSALSTARHEADKVEILSGVFSGRTTGTPICLMIKNADTHSSDYAELRTAARPGHADYSGYCKYHGFGDYRGGGHFSGRLTAPIVAAGAIALSALKSKGILVGTHIKKCAGICDRDYLNYENDIKSLAEMDFAVLDQNAAEAMRAGILAAKGDGDSVGGVLETVVIGFPAGVGEPWFDTLEGALSHALFSIPAVKGVEFGDGFAFADMRGSGANDPFRIRDGKVSTETNRNGGINGGISNGMPILFRCVVKPTPSIYKTQHTVDFVEMTDRDLFIKGRHDPAVVHRARVVADSVTALVLCDMLSQRYGTDFLGSAESVVKNAE